MQSANRLCLVTMLLRGLNALSFSQHVSSALLRDGMQLSSRHGFLSRAAHVYASAVDSLASLEAQVRAQGELVRSLKSNGGDEAAIGEAIQSLVALKAQ